jgi:CelD/BcsL family acetyltransferase involved in cellulose biosynthesis
MLTLERLDPDGVRWDELDAFADRTVFQTREWLSFLASTQQGEPVVAALREGSTTAGYFTGLVVRRYGVRLLGSPLPGWTTQYMGFNLTPQVSRAEALGALPPFAFADLGCMHLELCDRGVTRAEAEAAGYATRPAGTYLLDLRPDESSLLSAMESACRRNIRKAEREGVAIEEADDPRFADDYYGQLREVFGRRGLVPSYGVERVRELIRHLQPSRRLLLLRARDREGECIATGIFPATNRTAHFWGGASWREHQHLRPNEAIMWHAMRYWKRQGATEFDLGGLGGRYKQKFGPVEASLPQLLRSRYLPLARARDAARAAFYVRQRVAGRLRRVQAGQVR